MEVYFVRHGESALNRGGIHQYDDTELSPEGVAQARLLARRLASLPFDRVLASPYARARQTVEIVAGGASAPIEYLPAFAELRRPSAIHGRAMDEPEVVAIKRAIEEHAHDPAWRHSDEETFFDLRERAAGALDHLAALGAEGCARALVVTHGYFMVMCAAVMLHGPSLAPPDFRLLRGFLRVDNTGISVCEHVAGRWTLATWNDRAHLP